MEFIYVSSVCSDKKFNEIFDKSEVKPQQQAQKFHSLLSKGLCNYANNVYFISRPPINSTTKKDINLMGLEEVFENKTYYYLKILDSALLKHIGLFSSAFMYSIKSYFKNKTEQKIIICDILNLSISISALLSSKLFGMKSVAVITDLPNYMNYTNQSQSVITRFNSSIYRGICNFFLKKYDNYVILTEQMNGLVNPKNKPYTVIEGMVDTMMVNMPNILENKYGEKVVIYAGALYKKYGVKSLIEAFINVKDCDARLWLFGDGDLVNEIKNYEKKDSRIKYFGVVANEGVVREQIKATLLVNPRPSMEEFTKYSFPSKNMEYMASGTPVLTTPLQGMPQEYNDFVYLFDDETVEGMSKTLTKILSKDLRVLHEDGRKAKEFVIKEKNNFIQSKKIIDLVSN